jgi:hypothetical protein
MAGHGNEKRNEAKPWETRDTRDAAKPRTLLQITCIYKLGHNWSHINPVSANGRFLGLEAELDGCTAEITVMFGQFQMSNGCLLLLEFGSGRANRLHCCVLVTGLSVTAIIGKEIDRKAKRK